MKTKCLNLSLVLCLLTGMLAIANPVRAETTPWPVTDFWNYPYDPSTFDLISFGLYGDTPVEWTCHWDFGDGSTYDECWVNAAKKYSQDGDYTVSVKVTSDLGETTASRVLSIRTHDVAITNFIVPKSARVGQTRPITVYIRNTRYPERVQVELYKNDFEWIGTLIQNVPPRPANRTTAFAFKYTFTAEDAQNGKVTFHALAFILDNGGDDWPVDNDQISLPVRVFR